MNTIQHMGMKKAEGISLSFLSEMGSSRAVFMDFMRAAGYSEDEVVYMDTVFDTVFHEAQMKMVNIITKLSTPTFSKS